MLTGLGKEMTVIDLGLLGHRSISQRSYSTCVVVYVQGCSGGERGCWQEHAAGSIDARGT